LLVKGFKVTLIEDALGFKNEKNHEVAMKNMLAAGA
jgi:hypothetical protein